VWADNAAGIPAAVHSASETASATKKRRTFDIPDQSLLGIMKVQTHYLSESQVI
jgi:hypothetical protein